MAKDQLPSFNDNCASELSCQLTSAELQTRKRTVLQQLQKQMLETKELENGFAFMFDGSETTLDKLVTFIKSERQCCTFFTFQLTIQNDKNNIWLELTGPNGVKEFIKMEMGF